MRVHCSHDVWCRDVALKQVFSDLFLIAENKDASISSFFFLISKDASISSYLG